MPKFSIAAAHRITGVSRTTIQKHIKNGTISWELAPNGKGKLIEASELERAYGGKGKKLNWEEGGKPSSTSAKTASAEKTGRSVQGEVNSLREQLQKEIDERNREREHFSRQIDHLQDALQLAQEGQNSITKLLEAQSAGGGQWEKEIQNLEEKIANQQTEFESRVGEAKVEAKQEALEEIKSKPWWKIAFQ